MESIEFGRFTFFVDFADCKTKVKDNVSMYPHAYDMSNPADVARFVELTNELWEEVKLYRGTVK